MQLIEKVINTIKKHNLIENGDKLVVGVSGGPDSMCLLSILHSVKEVFNLELYVFHLNHMLRGAEADMEEAYVRDFCKRLAIAFKSKAVNIAEISRNSGLSVEEAARNIRYQEFSIYAKSVGASKLAVAHNRNDQAETILMHLIRGTGLDGLTGMEFKRGNIIRPLLETSRLEIEQYCTENNLLPKTDSSNLLNIYTRNRIRLELIPHINKIFETDISDSLFRMSELLKEDNDYISNSSLIAYHDSLIEENTQRVLLRIDKLKTYHAALVKRALRIGISKVKGELKGIEGIHIDAAMDLMNKNTGASINLPHTIVIEKSYNTLKILRVLKSNTTVRFKNPVNIPGSTYIEDPGYRIEASLLNRKETNLNFKKLNSSSLIQFFDYDKFDLGINIRSREPGDVIKPVNSNGTKKLKEYLIDNKIPREDRENIPIIAKGKEVIWLVGYKISDKFKVTENTINILKIEFFKNH